MAFSVRLDDEARLDLLESAAYIARESGVAATIRWTRDCLIVIRSLEEMPQRFATVPEPRLARRGIRHLIHGSHRIVYEVGEDEVRVLRVYHSRRRALQLGDLPPDRED